MGVVLVTRTVEPLSVPRCEMVPFLVAGARYVVWTCSGRFSAATETYTAAISPLCAGSVTVVALLGVVVIAAVAGQTVESRHRLLCSAIVMQLKSLADFCYKSVHLFRIDGHRLLQENVILLSTRHFQVNLERLDTILSKQNEGTTPASTATTLPNEKQQLGLVCKQ